ncbi:hypothetical protein AMTR_s00002p00142070 [Amborella trichopoda]|uniref:MI domain-containing protein n=1 Tax=Amborella trichopoda TaxID=13333 RepID=W1NZD1_AMBTC|nr:hypothetical protein AMTR_s00002p00142070 [Amborella trichopoda]
MCKKTSALSPVLLFALRWNGGLLFVIICHQCLQHLTFKPFYSANGEGEVASCIKDLNSPNFYPAMVSFWVTDSFERKDKEKDLLAKLLTNLCKSREGLLTEAHLIKGFEYVFSTLEDAIYDVPKAPVFLGQILVKVIRDNVISWSEVGSLILRGGEETGRGARATCPSWASNSWQGS